MADLSRRERQLLDDLLQAEVSRRLPEVWKLTEDLHRRGWRRPQTMRQCLRDISAFLRTSGFTAQTAAPHINDGFAATVSGSGPGGQMMLVGALGHGAVATAMAVGAATALSALRLRWPGGVTILLLPPDWQLGLLDEEGLGFDRLAGAISATVGRNDALVAPATSQVTLRLTFQARTDNEHEPDALGTAVLAYQEAMQHRTALPHSMRLTPELHSRQASWQGVRLAELHLRLGAFTAGELHELTQFAADLAARHGGVVAHLDATPPEPDATPAEPEAAVGEPGAAPDRDDVAPYPALTVPLPVWQRLGRQPRPIGGWDVIPNGVAALGAQLPLGVAVLGVGAAPGESGFTQALWANAGEKALRDGATLLAWQAVDLLMAAAAKQTETASTV